MSEILAPLLTFPGYRAHKLTGSLALLVAASQWELAVDLSIRG